MKVFFMYLWIQFKIDLRDKGILLNYYVVPIIFFFVMGAVFSTVNPEMKTTIAATMTIFAVTMGAVMGSPAPLVRMRESGTLRAFKVNGISGSFVLTVQAVSAFIHLFIVSLVIYIVSPAAFGSGIPENPLYFFLVLILFLFSSIGIGLLIGVTARNQSFATMFSMAVFLPTVLVSGIMFPAGMLPNTVMWIGRIFPATHALQAFYGLAYKISADINAYLALVILSGIGILMFVFSVLRLSSIKKSEQI